MNINLKYAIPVFSHFIRKFHLLLECLCRSKFQQSNFLKFEFGYQNIDKESLIVKEKTKSDFQQNIFLNQLLLSYGSF